MDDKPNTTVINALPHGLRLLDPAEYFIKLYLSFSKLTYSHFDI